MGVEFHDDRRSFWAKLPEDTDERCNVDKNGCWIDPGGCGARAAYRLEPGLRRFTPKNCLEHHRKFLADQERTGKIEWIERPLPGGGVQFIRRDRYAE